MKHFNNQHLAQKELIYFENLKYIYSKIKKNSRFSFSSTTDKVRL